MDGDPVPLVHFHPTVHGVILATGLFPHNLFSSQVLVEDERSPSDQGTRSLTADELADLWVNRPVAKITPCTVG